MTRFVAFREFLGRDVELAILEDRFREAVSGTGRIALVGGQPGIGKSRLSKEALQAAKGPGVRVASIACLDGVSSPFGVLGEIFREWGSEQLRRVLDGDAFEPLRKGLKPGKPREADDADEGFDRTAVYASAVTAIRAYSNNGSLVIFIDDLQWADQSSCEFLEYLLFRLASLRLFLLCTYRNSDLSASAALLRLIERAARMPEATRLELRPLRAPEIRTLLTSSVSQLPSDQSRKICNLAEGNPLFAEELLRQYIGAGGVEESVVPATVRALFEKRIQRLVPSDRDLLTIAAITGRYFDPIVLADLADRPIGEVLNALRNARDAQLLNEDSAHPGALEFRHALAREAVYESLLVIERRRLHLKIAERLRAAEDGGTLDAIAYHYWAAGDASNAVEYNAAAGDAAMEAAAVKDAIVLFERALDFCPKGDIEEATLRQKLGNALSLAGFPARACDQFESVLHYYQRADDPEKVAELALAVAHEQGNLPTLDSEQLWRLKALGALTRNTQSALYFGTLCGVAHGYAIRGQVAEAQRYLAEAKRCTVPNSDPALVDLCEAEGIVNGLLGRADDALLILKTGVEAAESVGKVNLVCRACVNASMVALNLGRVGDAIAWAERAESYARDLGVPLVTAWCLIIAAETHLAIGQLSRSRADLAEAMHLAEEIDSPRLTAYSAIAALAIGVRVDDEDLVARYAQRQFLDANFATDEMVVIGPATLAFATTYWYLGRVEEAKDVLRLGLAAVRSVGMSPALSHAVAAIGRPNDIPLAREMLSRWAQNDCNAIGTAYWQLFEGYCRKRRRESPVVAARAAAQGFQAAGLPLLEAEALEVAGELSRAKEIYARIGSSGDLRRLSHDGVGAKGSVLSLLSAREREVTRMVVAGKTNRSIAVDLTVSERTVESHLRSIFTKVGVNSRLELAAKVNQEQSASGFEHPSPS